jgi:hypothetical protein
MLIVGNLNPTYLKVKSMMPRIEAALVAIFVLFSAFANAEVLVSEQGSVYSAECIGEVHGTTESGVVCYEEKAKALQIENLQLYQTLLATIPKNNPNRKLLNQYMQAKTDELRFCELPFEMPYDWHKKPKNNHYEYADSVQAVCIYAVRLSQHGFLYNLVNP